ncbi:MAG TPA: bifunctional oligoribonuclease/PAP phosphatase NrnA [Candidatus Dormibacteraeota bacterium]|nr:bifunctional oligoribonuclease/PAP phosphatase NrnA [Candidatus Dormibacteraeota bacterium]
MIKTELRQQADRLKDLCERYDEILILGHKDADGDTLGCSLAFAEALETLGKTVHVVIPPALPQKYAWMPGFDRIRPAPPAGAEVRLVLFFDAGNMERSGDAIDHVTERATIVNVDHHASNSRFGDVNIIDPDASAVGQMCLEMLEQFGWRVTPTMATNLYTALLTDTGGFRHENTTPAALRDAARLAALGADPSYVATMVYKSRPPTTLRLCGLALAGIQIEMDGRLAWARVTRKMLHEAGAVMAEAEEIIDNVNSIAGLEVAVVFKEINARLTKISVRSRGEVDAAWLCERFSGGGHPRAAGAEIGQPLERAVPMVLAAVRQAIETAGAGSLDRGGERCVRES